MFSIALQSCFPGVDKLHNRMSLCVLESTYCQKDRVALEVTYGFYSHFRLRFIYIVTTGMNVGSSYGFNQSMKLKHFDVDFSESKNNFVNNLFTLVG